MYINNRKLRSIIEDFMSFSIHKKPGLKKKARKLGANALLHAAGEKKKPCFQ